MRLQRILLLIDGELQNDNESFTNGGVVGSGGKIEDIKRAVWRQEGFPDSSVG